MIIQLNSFEGFFWIGVLGLLLWVIVFTAVKAASNPRPPAYRKVYKTKSPQDFNIINDLPD